MADTSALKHERTPEVILQDWAGQNGEIRVRPILLIAGCWVAMSFGVLPLLLHFSGGMPMTSALSYGAYTAVLAALAMIPVGLKGYNRIRLRRVYKARKLLAEDTRESRMVGQVIVAADIIRNSSANRNPIVAAAMIDPIEVALGLVDAVVAHSEKPDTLQAKVESLADYALILKGLGGPIFRMAMSKDPVMEAQVRMDVERLRETKRRLASV